MKHALCNRNGRRARGCARGRLWRSSRSDSADSRLARRCRKRRGTGAAYRDAHGNDRDDMLRLVRGYFLAHGSVTIVSHIDSVELEGKDAARAVLHAGLIGRRARESLLGGTEGDLYRVEVELVAQDGTWRVIRADWRSQGGG